ncbi:response regulator [Ferviditalea candida]|uniref:Response regulator n=1 Tax=Ferviditalea candida TaxID=3108399 RepID=A0ABU5ZK15_9BACL|nr:response regulator [Paenibacillaceae bacterium T2]
MSGYSIMIMDDEATAEALRTALKSAGFNQIDCFSDPVKAMAAFETRKYHVLLADMDMPELDGIEVLSKVKKYDPMTQAIMTTTSSSIDRILICLELGASDYILKPYLNDTIVLEAIEASIKKLERWRTTIQGAVLKQSEANQEKT